MRGQRNKTKASSMSLGSEDPKAAESGTGTASESGAATPEISPVPTNAKPGSLIWKHRQRGAKPLSDEVAAGIFVPINVKEELARIRAERKAKAEVQSKASDPANPDDEGEPESAPDKGGAASHRKR